MLKRLISVCLIMCMIFAQPCFAAGEDENGPSEDMANLSFAKAMGIIDDTQAGSDVFSRGNLAKLVSSIILGDGDLTGYSGEMIFSDVSYDFAPYVNVAVSSGIMNGYGYDTFAPYNEVTYIQLIKTMVCVLGRKEQAEAYGGYPSGYFRVASELGINSFAPPDMNYTVTVDGVSNVLKLMLECDVAYLDLNGSLVYTGEHYLKYYRNIDLITGIVEKTGSSNKSGSENIDYIIIDGVYCNVADGAVENSDITGYLSDAYYHAGESGVKNIFYLEKHDSNTFVADPEQIEKAGQREVECSYNDKSIRLRLASDTMVIYNNEIAENYDVNTLNPFFENTVDGNVTFIDNDLDSIYEVIRIKAYDTYVISRIDNGIIYNKYHGDVVIDTNKLDKGVIVNVLMQPLEAEKLATGDVISVTRNLKGEITNIIVTIEYYSGTITGLVSDGSNVTGLEIDGTLYKISPGFYASPNKDSLHAGMNVKVYFNPEGRICEVDTDESVIYRIGYLADYANMGTMDKSNYFKILESDGRLVEYELRDKVSVEVGAVLKGTVSSDSAVLFAGFAEGKIKRQPVLYKTDESKKIRWIRYADEYAPKTEDGLYKHDDIANTSEYYLRSNSFGGHLLMGASTVIFIVPSEEDRHNDSLYTVMTVSSIDNGTQFDPFVAYGTKAYNPMAEIMVFERERSEVLSPSKYSDIFVVKSVSLGIGKNDEEVAKVCGYIAGKEETHELKPEIASGIKPGDIIQLGGKVNSVVSAINKVFYCDTRQMGETYDGTKLQNPTSTILYSDNRFVYGTVYYSDKSAFTLMVNDVPELSYLTGLFKIVLVDTMGRDVEVTPGHASGILAELDYPSQGSKVFVHTSAITPKTIVIYR